MKRFLLPLFLLVSLSFAGKNTMSNWSDESVINLFRSDSLRYGDPIVVTGSTLNALTLMVDDTSAVRLGADSINCTFGYRLGYILSNSNSKQDTAWGHRIIAGTVNMAAGTFLTPSLTTTTDTTTWAEVPTLNVIDTSNVTGYAVCTAQVSPLAGQLVQPWVQGTTGNKTLSYIKTKLVFSQFLGIPVRNQ